MDIFLRLRFVFWALVIGLWVMLFKQFCYDEPLQVPKAQPVQNPFRSAAASVPGNIEPFLPPSFERIAADEARIEAGSTETAPVEQPGETGISEHPISHAASEGILAPIAEKGFQGEARQETPKPEPAPAREQANESAAPLPEAPSRPASAPKGFRVVETRHFVVYWQSDPGAKFLQTIETLHQNLMLDLAPFAPSAEEQKVSLYLFDTQKAYQKFTGRPEWSGGASSLSRRSVYVYRSGEFMGILAHELTHVYFDPFFGERSSPLWLSEGLATLVQSERGFAPPNWLSPDLQRLADGGGFRVWQLMRVNTTAGADDDSVRLWYTESYSLVRFLLRLQRGPSFLRFCRELRDGKAVNEALLDSYGMPFNRVKALELAWRYDLSTHKLTRLPGSENIE